MAKNIISASVQTLTLTAPSGGVVSGGVYKIGALIVVSLINADAGEEFSCESHCLMQCNKVSAQAWTEGAAIYWDDTAKLFTTVSTGNTLCAKAVKAAANPSAEGAIFLNN